MALTPEQEILGANPELQDVSRQRKLAELLMAQGMQQPQGQMISGQYVAPSFAQQLNPLANIIAGQAVGERADTKQAQMAAALRGKQQQEIAQFGELLKVDPSKAYQFAAQSQVPQLREAALKKMMPQEFDLAEGAKRFMTLPDGTTKQIASGAEKYRAPIQIDTGTAIELRDPLDPTRVISRMPKSQMPNAGQIVERDDGTFLVDTRTGQARPITGQNGQPLTGGGKPLTEAQGNSVAFGARAIEANRIATNLEKEGVRNTGAIRTAVGGVAGMTPFIGEQLEQGVRSTFNVLPSAAGGPSEQQQQTEQARRNFVSAVLRKESGAAIGVDEYKNEERKYFPQAGDTDAVIKQKQKARELAIEALKAQAGPSGVRQINQIVNAQLSPQDAEALNWANSNPNDPRSAQIKQRLGR
jgi:hypothetical protein